MDSHLRITAGQYSDKGRKACNQDFHGLCVPGEPLLGTKGIAVALADGISSSDVSQVASQSAVTGFFEDYYATPDSWSVKTAAERVLSATNSWLHAQTQQSRHRHDKDRGYVCTFSALVLKSTTAHLFHVGDARIYRWRDGQLEALTEDHRVWVSAEQSYLARALGIDRRLEVDYRSLPLAVGDVFLLATDGVYEYLEARDVAAALEAAGDDLEGAAAALARQAYARGSGDNLTLQIVRLEQLPAPEANELYRQLQALPLPPPLEARMVFDGYRILRELRVGARSHIHLAVDEASGERVVIKTPAMGQRDDPAVLERFLLEEWVARRLNSPHVLKPQARPRPRQALYVVTEYVEGQTLAQWMVDHPAPDLAALRHWLEQAARGLRAFHRLEMVHQDLKPDNLMMDAAGTVKIIDFGATRVAGVEEQDSPIAQLNLLGASQYAAPEYFLGEAGSPRADIYSLGVIAYEMLSGRLPYGMAVVSARSPKAQKRLTYRSLVAAGVPPWIDGAIRKAVAVDPAQRYGDVDEFIYDLKRPNPALAHTRPVPLLARNPLRFWQGVSLVLAVLLVLVSGWQTVLR